MTKIKERDTVAADLLRGNHPLHRALVAWMQEHSGDGTPTKRKARRFLAEHPQYRVVQVAA